jgi:uncharacterized phage protein (TIGR01671 family)
MRVIKFRGFNAKNNQWLYGSHIINRGKHFVAPDEFAGDKTWEDYEVDPETIGQFTGLTDKNGHEIYEGDCLLSDENAEVFEVVYDAPRFCFKDNVFGFRFLNHPEFFHVIGNRYDNPELIEEGGEV